MDQAAKCQQSFSSGRCKCIGWDAIQRPSANAGIVLRLSSSFLFCVHRPLGWWLVGADFCILVLTNFPAVALVVEINHHAIAKTLLWVCKCIFVVIFAQIANPTAEKCSSVLGQNFQRVDQNLINSDFFVLEPATCLVPVFQVTFLYLGQHNPKIMTIENVHKLLTSMLLWNNVCCQIHNIYLCICFLF